MERTLNRALRGVATEKCDPYRDWDHACGEGRCAEWWEGARKLKSWKRLTNKAEMRYYLENYGPLVGVMAVHQSFLHYKGNGVYHSLGPQDPIIGYHCISVMGFDDEKGAWLIRNSWGEDWGISGYCWIKFGDSQIDREMFFIEPDGEIQPDSMPECPVSRIIVRLFGWRVLRFLRRIRDSLFA